MPDSMLNQQVRKTSSWWKPWGTSLLPSSCCSANKFKWFPFELGLWCCHSHAARTPHTDDVWTPAETIESSSTFLFIGFLFIFFSFCLFTHVTWIHFGHYRSTTWMCISACVSNTKVGENHLDPATHLPGSRSGARGWLDPGDFHLLLWIFPSYL